MELIESYWNKFGVCGILDMDTFYNQNILIKDKYKKLQININNFNDFFSSNYRRFVVVADAGYGKSTFVHEMARQWVKGNADWTKKFASLFLFRLTEVAENEAGSFRDLLSMCLSYNDSILVSQLLGETSYAEKSLFIFDGLDELHQKLGKEIDDIIRGKGAKFATVVITSRPCQMLQELEAVSSHNLYVELNGYTDVGVNLQLKKFSIDGNAIGNEFRKVLKVPLYNTLFCITHKDTVVGCLDICVAIEKFVKFACERHRQTHKEFSFDDENQLICALGQASQAKFSFIKGTDVTYPDVTQQVLSAAKNTGLVYQKSTLDDFVFAHQTIAEYCAAYFWFTTSPLEIGDISRHGNVSFDNPQNGSLRHQEMFSCFLSLLKLDYKLCLWQYFCDNVPKLNEYETLPKIWPASTAVTGQAPNKLSFNSHSVEDQKTILNKINFSSDEGIYLSSAHFDSEKFETITEMKRFDLYGCSIDLKPKEFFFHYSKIKSLFLYSCKFTEPETATHELNERLNIYPQLELLQIEHCDFSVINFLSYVMVKCSTLKQLEICYSFEKSMIDSTKIRMNLDKTGVDSTHFGALWINGSNRNKELFQSIEKIAIQCEDPLDLTRFFETLGKMVNLASIELIVERRLTMSERTALETSYENGFKNVNKFELKIKNEHGENINLSKKSVNMQK